MAAYSTWVRTAPERCWVWNYEMPWRAHILVMGVELRNAMPSSHAVLTNAMCNSFYKENPITLWKLRKARASRHLLSGQNLEHRRGQEQWTWSTGLVSGVQTFHIQKGY
eukprot:1145170-Pelagomonas_calceolata.AAC.1